MKLIPIARMGLAWARGAARLSYPPRMVSIEPTNVCNYRCAFCPQSDPEHRQLRRGKMSLEDLDQILDKIVEAKAAPHGTISFTHDGEPLLHPEFPEFIRRANQRRFAPRFSSNGSRLTPEMADRLEQAGSFRPSIDWSSSREVFESKRGRKDDWELIRGNLAYLIEMSNRNPQVSVEVFEMGTYDQPAQGEEMLQQLRSLLPTPTSDRVEFGIRVFHNAVGALESSPQSGTPEGDAALPDGRRRRYRRCPYPWSAMVIAFNGDVHACCRDLQGRTCLGNLLEADSLWDIWNAEAFQEFRRLIAAKRPDQLGACRGCDLPWSSDRSKWRLGNILRALRKR